MHNCKTARSGFIDLALDEIAPEKSRRLLAELNGCLECRQEYEAVRNTLHLSTQALRSGAASESFWPGYHSRLRDALRAKSTGESVQGVVVNSGRTPATTGSNRIWFALRTLLRTSIRVPLPAAAALIVLFALSVVGLRSQGHSTDIPATPLTPQTSLETKTVTVSVVQEKVITRVVYLPAKISRPDRRRFDRTTPSGLGGSLASITPTSGPGDLNLAGFAPTEKVRLTVIKGSDRDEK